MDVLCSHCNAKYFTAEKMFNKGNSFNDCCGNLRSLFENNHQKSKAIFERIRNYDSSFSFASFNLLTTGMTPYGVIP